jgi:arabinofuranosyltransferase
VNDASSTHRPPASLVLLGLLTVLLLARWVATAWVSDDAYITLRVVDNWLNGYGPRWNVVERVQVFTHPLWMLILTASCSLTREFFHTSVVLTLLCSSGTVLLLLRQAGAQTWSALLGAAILGGSTAFTDYSTSGLENPLSHLLLVGTLAALASGVGCWRWGLVGAGLLAMVRLDLMLLIAPALAFGWLNQTRAQRSWRPFLWGALVPALWFGFAWLYYGSPFPNTAHAKLATAIGRSELLAQGVRYLANSGANDPLTIGAIVLAGLLVVRAGDKLARATYVGVAFYLLYVVWIGGDFMSGRFLTAPLIASTFVLLRSLGSLEPTRLRLLALIWTGLATLGLFGLLRAPYDHDKFPEFVVERSGIADERGYYFQHSSWLAAFSKSQPDDSRVRAGVEARAQHHPIAIDGAVGFYGFFAGPEVHLVDYHALTDPLLSHLPAVEHDPIWVEQFEAQVGEPPRTSWRIGHFQRVIPKGYLQWILGDPSAVEDPGLREYLNRMALVTRAPLFAAGRLREIIRFQTGGNDGLLDGVRTTTWSPPRWDEVVRQKPEFPLARIEFGLTLVRFKQYDRALEQFEQALELDPNQPRAAFGAGVLWEGRGEFDRAETRYRQALQTQPDFAAAQSKLERLLQRKRKPPAA